MLTLDAFRRAARHDPRLELHIVGDGPLMEVVRSYLVEHELAERVHLHGRLSHARTLTMIRSSDILLHHAITSPTDGDTEGQPLVILEAMAVGVPPISTRHAGIPEVVIDRHNGRLVTERDVRSMAESIVELSGNRAERCRLGASAQRTIREHHSHQLARRTLLGLLEISETSTRVRAEVP
ncbi:hypothetical protein GCM10012284_02820 [Mangrovihabitans endophyticus]|uniref:Glycosyl transferase family 1 domain-containing protein n=2 Tax=Mangrovihabitans endophyticus TaxID=1751298 RepID=A0A8J3BT84_9ACTN|nr:hypothetical protein GCM10012284_02820 [Mangrovihabitans endophyticus]